MNEARQQERFKMNRPPVPGPRSLPQPAAACQSPIVATGCDDGVHTPRKL